MDEETKERGTAENCYREDTPGCEYSSQKFPVESECLQGGLSSLLGIREQNLMHVQHAESERQSFTTVYVAVLAVLIASVPIVANHGIRKQFLCIIIGFSLLLSFFGLLVSIRIQQVVHGLFKDNKKIAAMLHCGCVTGPVKARWWLSVNNLFIFLYAVMILLLGAVIALLYLTPILDSWTPL